MPKLARSEMTGAGGGPIGIAALDVKGGEFHFVKVEVKHQPDAVAIERLYFKQNVTTGITVAQARGVIALAAAQAGKPIGEFSPTEAKMAVTGYGRADKKQVIYMVTKLLKLAREPHPDDVADALAIAICTTHCMNSFAWRNRL